MKLLNWIGLGFTTKALAYEPFDRRLTRSRGHKTRHQTGHSVRRSDRHQKYVPARVVDIQNEEADNKSNSFFRRREDVK